MLDNRDVGEAPTGASSLSGRISACRTSIATSSSTSRGSPGSTCATTRSTRLAAQLNDILGAVSKVSELDLADVPPTSHPLDLVNVWAADEPRPCLTVDEALANAPRRDGDYFEVPPGGS